MHGLWALEKRKISKLMDESRVMTTLLAAEMSADSVSFFYGLT